MVTLYDKIIFMILVTGGTGLLGAHLLYDLVKSGSNVRALKRASSDTGRVRNTFEYYDSNADDLFNRIEWVNGELEDIYSLLEAMEGVDEVYHCAAMVSFSKKDTSLLHKINVEGTANMINAALEKNIRKFCHVSSVAALGKSTKENITEETPWKFSPEISNYSLSKYGAEREAWRGMEEGLKVVIVNPSIIIGPGNWSSGSSNMFNGGYKGIRYFTEGSSGFVDARDVSKAMIGLMASDLCNERFIISSENLSYKKFFDQIHDHFKRPRPSKKAGKFLSGLAWRTSVLNAFITGKNPLITKETARAAGQKILFSNEKIREKLGLNFKPLDRTISETCILYLKDLNK